MQNQGLRNPDELNRCFSCSKTGFCEFRIDRIIAIRIGKIKTSTIVILKIWKNGSVDFVSTEPLFFELERYVLQNADEYTRWFSIRKRDFCEFRIDKSICLIGKGRFY